MTDEATINVVKKTLDAGRGAGLLFILPLIWTGTLVNRLGGFVIPFLTLYLTAQRAIPVSTTAVWIRYRCAT